MQTYALKHKLGFFYQIKAAFFLWKAACEESLQARPLPRALRLERI